MADPDSRLPLRVTHLITRLILGGAQENTLASVLGLHGRPGLEVRLIAGPATGPEGSLEDGFRAAWRAQTSKVSTGQTASSLSPTGGEGWGEGASKPTSKDPAPLAPLTLLPALVRPLHPWKDARALVALTRLLRAQAPHLVHTHSGKAGFLGRLAARRAGVPLVVHTIHGPSFGPFQGPLANAVFRTAERLAARCTTHFVSVAHAMTRHYLAAGIGRPDQFTCIRSGFALEPFLAATNDPATRARWGLDAEDFVVGKIARLFKLKGHDELLEAAVAVVRQCPQARFLLVGDGPWRERLGRKARALGLERHVVFTGLVSPEEIPTLVGIMDVVVHLSRREGLPRALPQALAAGRPVVAYDCDGAAEVCLPEETGFLVRPGDLPALTRSLLRLAADPALRARLGRRGRELVRTDFGVERMVEQLDALYQRLARRAGLAPA